MGFLSWKRNPGVSGKDKQLFFSILYLWWMLISIRNILIWIRRNWSTCVTCCLCTCSVWLLTSTILFLIFKKSTLVQSPKKRHFYFGIKSVISFNTEASLKQFEVAGQLIPPLKQSWRGFNDHSSLLGSACRPSDVHDEGVLYDTWQGKRPFSSVVLKDEACADQTSLSNFVIKLQAFLSPTCSI